MLNYNRERYEDDLLNSQNHEVEQGQSKEGELTSAYGHVDWINDFNKAHSMISDDYDCNYSSLDSNTPIYDDKSEDITFSSSNTSIGAKQVVTIAVDDEVKSAKRKTLSNRARVHIVIYATLLILVLSMIIANAWMANLNNLKQGKAVHADSVQEYEDVSNLYNSAVFKSDPSGYYVNSGENNNSKIVSKNWFDKVCDNLDKN